MTGDEKAPETPTKAFDPIHEAVARYLESLALSVRQGFFEGLRVEWISGGDHVNVKVEAAMAKPAEYIMINFKQETK